MGMLLHCITVYVYLHVFSMVVIVSTAYVGYVLLGLGRVCIVSSEALRFSTDQRAEKRE